MNGLYIQRKKKKKKNPIKRLIGLLIVVSLIFGLFKGLQYSFTLITRLKVFTIKELKVDTPSNISKDRIIKLTGINENTHLYDISVSELRTRISKDPWVKKVRISRIIPSTIKISITPKNVVALTKVNGSIYYIDDNGNIVDKLIVGFKNDMPIINAPANKYLEIISVIDKLRSLGEVSEASLDEHVLSLYVSDFNTRIKLDIDNITSGTDLIKKVVNDLNQRKEMATIIDASLPGNKAVVKGLRKN